MKPRTALLTLMVAVLSPGLASDTRAAGQSEDGTASYRDYKRVIEKTAAMVSDENARRLAHRHGLNVLNVTWEDTGRYKDSAVGPNISDMTIQVQQMHPRTEKFQLYCMPVIRYPNFSDKSCDVPPDRFFLRVGNEKRGSLKRVSLKEFLGDIRGYLTQPDSWKGRGRSLLAERDTHVLVSAQACFLPIPRSGLATFNPVIFNYQSYEGDPAVLTILATREGTSVTVIDNKRDAFQAGQTWGQRLFFNQHGQRASLTGKRLSDFIRQEEPRDGQGGATEAAGQKGLNMVMLIQVPLKQKNPMRSGWALESADSDAAGYGPKAMAPRSDVEAAVIGHGRVEGPFTEIAGLKIERDPKYPIRVTVQFYKATSNGVVNDQDLSEIAEQINRVYRDADFVGSLVVEGDTGRPTEHGGPKFEPPGWWDEFWKRHQANVGMTPEETLQMLRKLYGPNWTPRNEYELMGAIRKLKESQKDK